VIIQTKEKLLVYNLSKAREGETVHATLLVSITYDNHNLVQLAFKPNIGNKDRIIMATTEGCISISISDESITKLGNDKIKAISLHGDNFVYALRKAGNGQDQGLYLYEIDQLFNTDQQDKDGFLLCDVDVTFSAQIDYSVK
jgi:hypothetical protein